MHLIGSLRLKVAILVGTFSMNKKMLKEATRKGSHHDIVR